jgi:hypothetical protein
VTEPVPHGKAMAPMSREDSFAQSHFFTFSPAKPNITVAFLI